MSYARVQLYLYRPFLHYAIKFSTNQRPTASNMSTFAVASIQASENIIALCEGMYSWNLLEGSWWPVGQMLTSSLLTILYFVVASQAPQASPETHVLLESLATGLKIIRHLAKRNYLANRGKVMFTVSINPAWAYAYQSLRYTMKIMISTLPRKLQHIQDRLLDSIAKDFQENQTESPSQNSDPFNDEVTARLASQTFTLSPKLGSHGLGPDFPAADQETELGMPLNSSQWNPEVPNTKDSTTTVFQQDPAGLAEHSASYGLSNDSSDPSIVNGQIDSQDQCLDETGDGSGLLQAQPLYLQQGCMNETWSNALKMASLHYSDDFQSSFSFLENEGQPFDLDSWL